MRNKSLGKGDKCSISGDPNDQGLNLRESTSNSEKLRGDTGKAQQPKHKKSSISSDRGSFKVR